MSVEGTHHVDSNDSFGKKVGLQAAVLAVLLSIFTIYAHRAHTETIVMENEASNQWSHYQAKRIRDYQLQMNSDLLKLVAAKNPETERTLTDYSRKRSEYGRELDDIKKSAEEKTHEGGAAHRKALYFDLSEGVLEISLVLSSLYFLSHKELFPAIGLLFGLAATVVGVFGLILH